jgi:NDP-sugar pyrophosphorylase family protein
MSNKLQRHSTGGNSNTTTTTNNLPNPPPQSTEDDTKVQHPLQAVVLADSFTKTFRPMSLEVPKVLLPVCNTPMLEYTLEMLANAKVKDIIVVCCWHAEKVSQYINKSRWKKSKSPIVRIFDARSASSAGDALRELANANEVRSDPFVLISGDVVSNVRLIPILRAHEARKDRGKIMTLVFRRALQGNRLRELSDETCVVIDSSSKRLLLYEVEDGEPDPDTNEIQVNIGNDVFFKEHPKVQIRHDLLDCHIDICSPTLLNIISDDFYGDLRSDMLRNEVAKSTSLGNYFYAYEITSPTDYAARVTSMRCYDQVSRDVIRRWLYPLVPDNNWDRSMGTCTFNRGFLYRENNVFVDRSAKIGKGVMLGADSVIGEGVIIENSVLGRKVYVEAGAEIRDSYLWDGCIIRSQAKINKAVICHLAIIGERTSIQRGTVVSFGVVVGNDSIIPPFTRLTGANPYVDENAECWDASSEEGNSYDGGNNNNNNNNNTVVAPSLLSLFNNNSTTVQPSLLLSTATATTTTSNPDSSTGVNTTLTRRRTMESAELERIELGAEFNGISRYPTHAVRAYQPDEEEPGWSKAPQWAEEAIINLSENDNDSLGKYKAFLRVEMVMSSMGAKELEVAKLNRNWILVPEITRGEEDGRKTLGDLIRQSSHNLPGMVITRTPSAILTDKSSSSSLNRLLPLSIPPTPTTTTNNSDSHNNSTNDLTATSTSSNNIIVSMNRDIITLKLGIVDIVARALDVRGVLDKNFIASMVLELRGLRASQENCSFARLIRILTPALLSIAATTPEGLSFRELSMQINSAIIRFGPLLKQFTQKQDGLGDDLPVQVALLDSMELTCLIGPSAAAEIFLEEESDGLINILSRIVKLSSGDNDVGPLSNCFPPALVTLYGEAELVSIQALEWWIENRKSIGGELLKVGGSSPNSSSEGGIGMKMYPNNVKISKAIDQFFEQVVGGDDDDEDEGDD